MDLASEDRPRPVGLETLPVFERWTEFLGWLLATTDGFPKKARFTLTNRIDNLALDVLDDLTSAAYTRDRREILAGANLRLTRLRVMLRLSRDIGYLSGERFERAVRVIDETGRMIGGWTKSAPPSS